MGLVIAIDAGTTGVRSLAINESGVPVGIAYREFTQFFPEPGRVEHDADEIWDAVLITWLPKLRETVDEPVAAIGITNQRETVVVWDKRNGQPLHRAIVCRTGGRRRAATSSSRPAIWQWSAIAPAWCSIRIFGQQARMDPRSWRSGPPRATGFGTIDSWPDLEADGSAIHATDPVERQPNDALRHPRYAMVRRAL